MNSNLSCFLYIPKLCPKTSFYNSSLNSRFILESICSRVHLLLPYYNHFPRMSLPDDVHYGTRETMLKPFDCDPYFDNAFRKWVYKCKQSLLCPHTGNRLTEAGLRNLISIREMNRNEHLEKVAAAEAFMKETWSHTVTVAGKNRGTSKGSRSPVTAWDRSRSPIGQLEKAGGLADFLVPSNLIVNFV